MPERPSNRPEVVAGEHRVEMVQIDSVVYRKAWARGDWQAMAVFYWAKDAVAWVDAQVAEGPWKREDYEIRNLTGRRIKGVTSHGRAILDALDARSLSCEGSGS
jgi:hypothetical protein